MKIGIVSSFKRKYACGLKIYAERLVQELKKLGVNVEKISIDENSVFYGLKLRKEVTKKNFSLIEIEHEFGIFKKLFFIKGFSIIPYFLKKPLTKTVTTFHTLSDEIYSSETFKQNPFFMNRFRLYREFKALCQRESLKMIFDNSDAIIVQTRDAINLMNKLGYGDKIYYLPHPTPKIELKIKEPEYDLISFGILSSTKRYDLVFYALKDMDIKYLLHVSKYAEKAYFDKLVSIARTIRPKIMFKMGYLLDDELFTLISKSKAVLIPPCPHEASPSGVLHDAIAVKKPVIAPRVGEYKDFAEYILTYETLEEMKEYVEKILSSEKFRKYWEMRAKQLAEITNYERITRERLKLYEQII